MKKTLLVSILLIPLMLIVAQIGYAGNPLPPLLPGSEYGNCIGPDITGTLIVQYAGSAGILVTFNGNCRNFPVNYSQVPFPIAFDLITPQFLLGTCGGCTGSSLTCDGPQELPFEFPESCKPNNKDTNLYPVVYKIIHFVDGPSTKIIDIVGRWPIIICPK